MKMLRRIHTRKRKGMTLVEALLSVSVLSALFILVQSKIDIGDIFAKLHSTGDEIAVRAIGEAVTNYRWSNEGDLPPAAQVTTDLKYVCKKTVSEEECTTNSGVYLGELVPDYLDTFPVHDEYGSESELMTGYRIQFPVRGGRVRVVNPDESEEFVH